MTSARQRGRARADGLKEVVFIQNAIPPLRDGEYLLSATQEIPGQDPGRFSAAATFVVTGERFSIQPAEIDSIFPPSLANGEFDGVLAHVVFNRRTLPWERRINTPGSSRSYPDAPWLAVLVCDDASAPELADATAADLVPDGTRITVRGSTVTGEGTLPPTTLSYGAALLHELGYGESPHDPCLVIDLPVEMFSQIAPAAADLEYLAHIREVDTLEGADSATTSEQHAVVFGNRVPAVGGVTRAMLVSLEGMADYLPGPDGTPSQAIPPRTEKVRLVVFQSWTFTVNDMDETLRKLLEGLNEGGGTPVSTLMLPITGSAPSPADVARAMASQAGGTVPPDDARILMQNALLMGYMPADHHLRHGGHTVSFYRGPFVPLAVPSTGATVYSGSDAANAYNPQTGMFDASYGAAWQLGQLLMLQSSGVANELYQWKRTVTLRQAVAAEDAVLAERLGGAEVFPSFFARRAAAAGADPPPLPDDVVKWFGDLAGLNGVPFNYLVPDERMLPPESIRFFHVDQNWLDALIDGAFSIGRASVSGSSLEAAHAPAVRRVARAAASRRRANRPSVNRHGAADSGPVSGFLLRSQAVAGWPNLRVSGYSDTRVTNPVDTVRLGRLSDDTMLCLFAGVVGSIYLREPPEQLHHGVSGPASGSYTILRSVYGGPGDFAPGEQYTRSPKVVRTPCDPEGTHPWTCMPLRADGRTILISEAATAIRTRLSADFEQTFHDGFTAAEFALEMTKGVVEVEFTTDPRAARSRT
jgi:hypothetical protein